MKKNNIPNRISSDLSLRAKRSNLSRLSNGVKDCFVASLLALTVSCGGGYVIPSYPLAGAHNPAWPTPSTNSTVENDTSPPPPEKISSDPFMDQVTSFQPGPYAGFGQNDFPDIVLGGPQGGGAYQGGSDVLSLGVGGTITLKSDTPILNGPGVDFIVFENPFWAGGNPQTPFAELGAVSVSQNGTQFFPFPCEENNEAELFPGCAGVSPVFANVVTNNIDPTDPDTAGGDAFDLKDVGLDWILYIRIQDRSDAGSGNSAGFDLDAIAIVYQ